MAGSVWGCWGAFSLAEIQEGHNGNKAAEMSWNHILEDLESQSWAHFSGALWLKLGIQNINSCTLFPNRPLCFIFGRKLLTLWQPSTRASKVTSRMNSLHWRYESWGHSKNLANIMFTSHCLLGAIIIIPIDSQCPRENYASSTVLYCISIQYNSKSQQYKNTAWTLGFMLLEMNCGDCFKWLVWCC